MLFLGYLPLEPLTDDNPTSDGANRYGARATGAAPGSKSIRNATCRVGGIPGKSSGKTSRNSRTTVRIPFPKGMRTSFSAQAITALYLDNQPMAIITSKLPSSTGTRAVSFKMSLSSALIAIVALLIIVVIVVVGVVFIVAVVVVGVVVIVGICRSASTVPRQMANPFAIIAPRWERTFMMVITLGT
nr:hypothetical protein [Tanacetum cinerariifolium]